MSMEKNGAISSNTPQADCDNRCGCNCKTKQASEWVQLELFPEDAATADAIDRDVIKDAADAVKQASKNSQ
jgi:hypothetical protein